MTKMRWTASVQVDGLFTTNVVQSDFDAQAIDRVSVSVPAGETDFEVAVQPGDADALRLLVVKASAYSDTLTYAREAGATAVVLTGPHLVSGGALALFGGPVNTLHFANGGADAVDVEILVARDAA